MKTDALIRGSLFAGILVFSLLILTSPSQTRAQLGSRDSQDTPAPGVIELDIAALLTSPNVFPASVQGRVWTFTPGPARRLVMVPLNIKAVDGDIHLDRSTVSLRGSRAKFFAWHIMPEGTDRLYSYRDNPGRARDAGTGRSAGRSIAGGLGRRDQAFNELTGDFSRDASRDPRAARQRGLSSPQTGFTGANMVSYEDRKEIPRFATKMKVTVDETVNWEVERLRDGEVVNDGQLYPMKIDFSLLNERNPSSASSTSSTSGVNRAGATAAGRGTTDRSSGRSSAGRSSGRSSAGRSSANRSSGRSSAGRSSGGRSTDRSASRGATRTVARTNTASSREAAERERAEAEIERAQRTQAREAFNDLRDEVRSLPEDFEEAQPERVWALFEVSELEDDFELKSDRYPNLNWKLSFDQLNMLRGMSMSGISPGQDMSGNQVLLPAHKAMFVHLGLMIQEDNHPYSQQAVASTMHFARLGHYTRMGDQLFFIFQSLLEGQDAEARRIAQQELLRTVPPNQATLSLLSQIAKNTDIDPMAKLEAMKGVISGMTQSFNDPGAIEEKLAAANQMLGDANGPPPAPLLDSLLDVARREPDTVPALIRGIQFHRLTEARLQQVLVSVAENAGKEPLAAGWLDEKFLSATSSAIVHRTLNVIVDADTGAQSLGPMFQWGLNKVLGVPTNAASTLKARIAYKIPVENVQHGLIRSLQHGDSEIRELAWQALPRFKFTPSQEGVGVEDPFGQEQLADRYRVLLDAALEQSPTPPQVVPFLAAQPEIIRRERGRQQFNLAARMANANQRGGRPAVRGPGGFGGGPVPGQPGGFPAPAPAQPSSASRSDIDTSIEHPDVLKAVKALVQIVLRGSTSASTAASRSLLGSNWPVSDALFDLEFGERQGFAMRTYENLTGRVPWVTNVLRQRVDRNEVLEWYGDQLAMGVLPDPSQWVNAFSGGEDALLGLALANDTDLAKGAVAVLVASAGGQDRLAQQLFAKLRTLPDQSPAKVAAMWRTERAEIYAQRIRRLEGPYRLVLRVGPSNSLVPAPGAGGSPQAVGGGPGGPGGPPPPGGLPAGAGAQAPAAPVAPAVSVQLPEEYESQIVVGVIQLSIEGRTVSFGNQTVNLSLHPSSLAIRVAQASEFAGFENEEISQLPLDNATQAVDLVPQDNGTWHGAFNIDGNKAVYVFLEPANEA